MPKHTHHRAFTLIELLVVVTIIVILIALLSPALDKAIYQGELAVCGANQRTVANTATLYAHDHKRLYPSRDPNYAWDSIIIRHPNENPQYPLHDQSKPGWTGGWDLRPLYKPYMSLDAFLDPLSMQGLSVDPEDNEDDPNIRGDVHVYAGFHVNTGWKSPDVPVPGVPPTQPLRKLGQRWTATAALDIPNQANWVNHRFSILTADVDNSARGQGWVQSSHPDMVGGLLWLQQWQAKDAAPDFLSPVVGGKFVQTWGVWVRNGGYPQGAHKGDFNYGQTDGSVLRENGVLYDDDRMAKIIATSWGEYAGVQNRYWQLPKAGG